MNPTPAPTAPTAPAANPQAITASSPTQGQALQAPATAVPTYDVSGAIGALRNYYQIPQATQAMEAQGGALATRGQQQITQNEISSQWAQQVAERQVDPSSYRLQSDPKGGPSKIYNIYTGKLIDPLEYSQLTGQDPTAIYKNSPNKLDQTFVQDYQNYQTLMQAMLSPQLTESKNLITDYVKNNPQLKGMTPEQLRQRFMQVYSAYFGGVGAAPQSTAFAPQYAPSAIQYGTERQFLYGTMPAGYIGGVQPTTSPPAGNPISSGTSP